MAKKTPRNEANDESATPAAPPPRRARTSGRRQTGREPATADATASQASASSDAVESMSPENQVGPDSPGTYDPSEDDIRVRAYLRYLERGGGQGLEFEDWVEAERELKTKKQ
jgi:DUF2934 family protein